MSPESFSIDDLKKVGGMLQRKRQIDNAVNEFDDKIETLERQKAAVLSELAEIQVALGGKYAELVEAAQAFVGNVSVIPPDDDGFKIYNPKYVTNSDKETLLAKILSDFKAENPKSDGMTFQQVKNVLASRYGVETRTIGNFFRRQLPSYETKGGNKKKVIVKKKVVVLEK